MLATKSAPDVPLEDAGYLLNRVEVERMGRWASYRRSAVAMVFLAFLALPLSLVVVGWLPNRAPALPLGVLSRIALVIETLLLIAVVVVALRARELVQSARAPGRVVVVAHGVFVAVCVLCALDAAENVWLGTVARGVPRGWTVEFHVVVLGSVAALLVAGAALAVVSSPAFWWRRAGDRSLVRRFVMPGSFLAVPTRRLIEVASGLKGAELQEASRRWRAVLEDPVKAQASPPEPDGVVICCSGGGIRSASFCLGGLQTLSAHGIYDRARAVVGVSGGGYIAAAFHVMRWRSGDDGWKELDPPAFHPNSPEMRWLRRHSRYLVESLRVATLGFLALLYGMAVNLAWLVLVMVAVASWLALFFQVSGGVQSLGGVDAVGAGYEGAWEWVRWVWLLSAAGLLLYVGERMTERFVTVLHETRERVRFAAVYLIWLGVALAVALLALPAGIAAVHDWAVTSDSASAGLAHQLGLVSTEACNTRLPGADACGISATAGDETSSSGIALPASLATVVAAIISVVQAARANLSPDTTSERKRLSRTLVKAWALVRDAVVPWVAALVVGLVVLLVVWRWTASLVADPSPLGDWGMASALVAAAAGLRLTTDANRTSLHHFYRERLSYAYFVSRDGRRARPLKYREAVRFSQSAPPVGHGPEMVSCAVANVSDTAYVPADRHCTPFVFDARGMGLTDDSLPSGPALTASVIYERAADNSARDATMAGAIAISGAAFSPLVGRQNVRVGPFRAVLALANARLGVWLPNPIWVDDVAETALLVRRRLPEAVQAYDQLAGRDRGALLGRLRGADRSWFVAALVEATRQHREAYRALDRPGRDAFRRRLCNEALHRLDVLMAPVVRAEYAAVAPSERAEHLALLSAEERARLEVGLAGDVVRGEASSELLSPQAWRLLRRYEADGRMCADYETWSAERRRLERERLVPERHAQLRARLDTERWRASRDLGPTERASRLASMSARHHALVLLHDLADDPDAELPQASSWSRVDPSVHLRLAWREIVGKPGPFRLVKEAFGRTSVLDRRLYVTDGGHYDNLGLVEALRRRPAEVFVLDASADPEDTFRALGDAIATARIDLGVEIDLELSGLIRGKEQPTAKAAWTTGTATWPDGATAAVHLVKVVMVDGLPWDTTSYKLANPEFPLTSTGRQLYGEFDLEAYRVLGRELTERLLTSRAEAGAGAPAVPTPWTAVAQTPASAGRQTGEVARSSLGAEDAPVP